LKLITFFKMSIKKEKTRLKKVAKWFNPSERQVEFDFIGYPLDAMLPYIKGPAILEMGCSTGVMTRRLAKIFSDITVIDGSEEYIERLRKIIKGGKIKFIVSLFEDFESDEKFDDIILANALEHIMDPVLILAKAKKWLKKDGRIHIIVPNAESLHRRIGQKIGMLKKNTDFSKNDRRIGHRRVYTKELLEKDVKRAGLCVKKSQGIFLKPFSNSQMGTFNKKIFDALYEIGKDLPDYCSTIYFVCKKW